MNQKKRKPIPPKKMGPNAAWLLLFLLLGVENQCHYAAFKGGGFFNFSDLEDVFCESIQNLSSEVYVFHLPSPETHCYFHFIASFQELLQMC